MIDSAPEWLKATVPGIILLGAVGSLLALLLLYILKVIIRSFAHLFRKVLPEQAKRIAAEYKRLYKKFMFSYGYRLGGYSSDFNLAWGVAFFFAYHVLCTLCLLLIASTLIHVVIAAAIAGQHAVGLTVTTYILTVTAMLFLFWSLRHFLHVFLAYHNFPGLLNWELKRASEAAKPVSTQKEKSKEQDHDPPQGVGSPDP